MKKTAIFLILYLVLGCFFLFLDKVLADTCVCEDGTSYSVTSEDECVNQCGGNPFNVKSYTKEEVEGKGEVKTPVYQLESPIKAETIPELIGSIIKAILGIVGALALLMFVYGGFVWLTSGGSADKIKKGKDIIVWATIGLIVIFASYALVSFVIRAIGG
jgi:hypothetical protein